MQHFQSILIVIGFIAIGAVLIHGYFSIRKEKIALNEADKANTSVRRVDIFAEQTVHDENEILASDGVGEVSIISHHNTENEEPSIDFSKSLTTENEAPVVLTDVDSSTVLESDIEEIGSDLQIDDIEEIAQCDMSDEPQVEAEMSRLEESHNEVKPSNDDDTADALETNTIEPKDLFIFNVVAKEGHFLGGHELLQFFLTSGFRFGDMSIFHRHEHSDGTGPVLFSIANMMAPGFFDPDNMEQFQSEGVSFFLMAPNDLISIKKSFGLMLRAVEQLAEEFDCDVLNADRKKMTTEQFIEYNNRLEHYN